MKGWCRVLATLVVVLTVCGVPLAVGTPARAAAAITCAPATGATPPPATAAPPAAASPTAVPFPSGGGSLTVFAAASLTDAFNAMKTALEAAHPGLKITYNFGGSPTLVTQLTQGAKADVFASADETQMNVAIKNGVIAGTPVLFARNRLAIVVPKNNPGKVQGPADLAKPGVSLVLAAPAVPVGNYGRQALCKMGADAATYGSDFVAKVNGNVVSAGEEDVKAVLAKVELGQADAGIVYTTDVTPQAAKEVTLIPIPDNVNIIAQYPIAPVKGGNAQLAAAFIAYVVGPAGQATLHQYGFEPRP